jgi:nucleotide-binding universal stress UspA family protein
VALCSFPRLHNGYLNGEKGGPCGANNGGRHSRCYGEVGVEIHRILCPSDFSEASAHAADQAVVLAEAYKAKIVALHAVSPLTSATEAAAMGECRNRLRVCFERATKAGIAVDIDIALGLPVHRILECASSLPADVIVMGTHGEGGFEHFVLGSVTEKVLRKARCPVLTVPPRARTTSRLPFKHLLCAVDFSDASTAAVQWAISLAHESSASVTLLHVIEWPWHEPPPPAISQLPREQADALMAFRRYTEQSATNRLESLLPQNIDSQQAETLLRNGKAWTEILDVANQEHSDLIVMGVRGRNPVDMTLFGSTANQVVRQASCPVLTVH